MSSGSKHVSSVIRPAAQAVIFDMDGTLTRPCLDFQGIRAEIGLTSDTPILEALAQMPPDERARAEAILHRHEDDAAVASELQDHAARVVAELRRRGLRLGVLTRNRRSCVEIVLQRHGLLFDAVHTREDGPVKPAPDAILSMCRSWRIAPAATWLVGDYLFDIQAGRAAGTTTVLMIGDGPPPLYADQADHVIRALPELLDLLGP